MLKDYEANQVPEPTLKLDSKKIWESQVIFPYSLNDTVYAYGGPKPDDNNRNKDTMSIFPVYQPCAPRVFIDEPYNFSYIKPPNKGFRSAPSVNEQYLKWLNRVKGNYAEFWKSYGIYEFIQLSKTGLKYQQEMLIVALHFFETSTNTFHFECGMMTPTLFDVAAITGLPPTGETYDPLKASDNIKLIYKANAYSKYIAEHQKDSEEVEDTEHVAFLA
ncbi:hypothetical protein A2U01_0038219, partial [Trifolium medium]|nr:hypothetical protein [Trifolium medium]